MLFTDNVIVKRKKRNIPPFDAGLQGLRDKHFRPLAVREGKGAFCPVTGCESGCLQSTIRSPARKAGRDKKNR